MWFIPTNAYVEIDGFSEAYVRIGRRFLAGQWRTCFDLARLIAAKPGAGAFGRLVETVMREYRIAVYVEAVGNERFAAKLRREGWAEVFGGYAPSFYMLAAEGTSIG